MHFICLGKLCGPGQPRPFQRGAIDPFSIIFRPVKNFKVFLSGRAKNQKGRIIEWGTVSWPGLHKRGGAIGRGLKALRRAKYLNFRPSFTP